MSLVTSAPLDGAPPGRYERARRDKYEISATISDIAHELADRCLRHDNPTGASWTANKGLLAEPVSETLWRDAIHAAWQTNHPEHIRTVVANARDHVPGPSPELDTEATRATTAPAGADK